MAGEFIGTLGLRYFHLVRLASGIVYKQISLLHVIHAVHSIEVPLSIL